MSSSAGADGSARGARVLTGNRLVRPYYLTKGRTRSFGRTLPYEALVSSDTVAPPGIDRSSGAVLDLCRRECISIVEIAARLEYPVGSVRVMVGDLEAEGLVKITTGESGSQERLSVSFLERFLHDLGTV